MLYYIIYLLLSLGVISSEQEYHSADEQTQQAWETIIITDVTNQ